MNDQKQTETGAQARLDNAARVHTGHGEVPFLVVPEGHKVENLEALQRQPRRIRESISVTTIESFIAYVTKHKTGLAAIFANEEQRQLQAVLDYHGDASLPSWCTHKVGYTAKLSREATAWLGMDGKAMEQIALAEFIEEHIADVVAPAGADLLERALKLQFIQKAVFGSAVRLQSGEFQLQWSVENQKGTVELPEKIAIGIPVFHNGAAYRIEARLRYRLNEGKVTFTYKLIEPQRVLERAFADVVKKAIEGVGEGVQLYYGSR